MPNPSIILNTKDGIHKITLNEPITIGTDFHEFGVVIPIICDTCKRRIYYDDELEQTESHEREMGSEIYWINSTSDIYCPRCDSPIHVQVEIHEYANHFDFHDCENQNCSFSHVYDLETLSD